MILPYVIEPSSFQAFEGESDELDKCKEWGLLSDKAVKPKTYVYKKSGESLSCRIVGFVDNMTAVIAFDDGRKHCIHPSFLKEMQAASYTQRIGGAIGEPGREEADAEEPADAAEGATVDVAKTRDVTSSAAASVKTEPADAAKADKPETKADKPEATSSAGKSKGKAPKLELPEEKVKMTATVQEFTTVPNHFTEEEDEVVIYGDVSIVEPELAVGTAWSSHSATLKKLELAVGDTIAFEAKIVAKKLSKHPVPYKINNPAKIVKQ